MPRLSPSILLFLCSQLFFSCLGIASMQDEIQLVPASNIGSKPNRQYKRNLSSKDIDYAIINKDYSKAATVLSQLQELNSKERSKYLSTIKEGLGDLFLETLDRDGILATLGYYYSLQSLGEAEKYISENDFAEKLFDFYHTKEYFGAALDFAQTSLQNNLDLSPALQSKFQKFIQEQFHAEKIDSLQHNFWEQRLQGSVTIFVQMGTERIPNTPLYAPYAEVGSGFFIDKQGSIITNYHVIKSQTEKERKQGHIFVKLTAKDELVPAKLIGWDPNRDLALLRISRKAPYLLRMNNSYNMLKDTASSSPNPALAIGNELFTIGSPGGILESTLTSGRISARGRDIEALSEAIQIDAPVNQGNSGGPLLNKQGDIEGIVFAKYKNDFEGVAFAIPSDTLSSILPRLYLGGKVKNSWLGIIVDEYQNNTDYLKIRYIFPNSPAAEARLQAGMRILSYRGKPYSKSRPLQNQISNSPSGAIVELRVQEADTNKVRSVTLELAERPDKPMYHNLEQDSSSQLFYALFGLKLQISQSKRDTYEVLDSLPYSQISQFNFQQGDQIQILQWLMDTQKNIIVAHISYIYKDDLDATTKQTVLIQELDLPNVL